MDVEYESVDIEGSDESIVGETSSNVSDSVKSSSLIYPCVIAKGSTSAEEFNYILSLLKEERTSSNDVDFYLEFQGITKNFGYLPLTLDTLFDFKYTLNYRLELHVNEESYKLLDLDNGNLLEMFISYGGEV